MRQEGACNCNKQGGKDVGRTEQDQTTLLIANSLETEQLILAFKSTLATTAVAKSQAHVVKTARKNDGEVNDEALIGCA